MDERKLYSLLGLAEKSKNLVSGELMTEKKVKSGKAYLVIVGEDASENTRKMFQNMCDFYHVPLYFYGTKEKLGHAMGKELRASLAVTDEGFAKAMREHLDARTV